jgi:SagB-type dehydrogenase family enzyme
MSLEQALAGRRSVRSFRADPISPQDVSQLLWAAQGVTHDDRLRTAPSAGSLYSLELYAAGPAGTLRYIPDGHRAERWSTRDQRPDLATAGDSPEALKGADVVFVVTVSPARLAGKYGGRAVRYADLEAGHGTQNLLLQAVCLDLGAVPIGSFDDAAVASVLDLPVGESPRYLVAVGRPRA